MIEVKDHPYPLVNNFPAVKTTQPRRDKSSKNITQGATSKKDIVGSATSQNDQYQQKNTKKTQLRSTAPQNDLYKQTITKKTQLGSVTQQKTQADEMSRDKKTFRKNAFDVTDTKPSSPKKRYDKSTQKTSYKEAGSSRKNTSFQQDTRQKLSTQEVEAPKKYRMTADGTLKEKRNSFMRFTKRSKKK